MRIGIAMQSLDPTWGGIGIYTEASVEHLLKIDRNNEYFLIYSGCSEACDQLGSYSQAYGYAVEIETPKPLLSICTYWDQITFPDIAIKQRIDLRSIRSGPLHSFANSKKSLLFRRSSKIWRIWFLLWSEGEV